MRQYWLAHDGQKSGPYEEESLRSRLARGELLATDLVWTEGMPQWRPAVEALRPEPASPAGASPYRAPSAQVGSESESPGAPAYAGFWVRLGAAFLDTLVLGVPLFLAIGVAATLLGDEFSGRAAVLGVYLLPAVVAWLYFATMESGPRGATLGKRALHLQVLSAERLEPIGFARAGGRYCGRYLSAAILYIGYLMQPFTARKQALHDLLSRTVVVARKPAPTALVVIAVIFALLMPIGAMVAAIAIPAYTDYTVRAKVADALAASADARDAVHEYIELNDALPPSLEVAGIRFVPTPNVRSLALDPRTAALTLTLGFAPLEAKTIVLAPRRDAARNLTWSCLEGTAPAKYLPRSCRGE